MTSIPGSRLDSNQSLFFSRYLESIDPTRYYELFSGLRARRFVPPVGNLGPYDRAYTYRMYTLTGEARAYGQNANDLPRVGVTAQEFSRAIRPIGAMYGWTTDEIRGAAASGVPLEETTVMAAMSAIERKIDRDIAIGDAANGFTGLANDADIATDNSITVVNSWGTDPEDWMASLVKLVADTRARCNQAAEMPGGDVLPAFDRFQILMPPTQFGQVATTPFSTTNSESVLSVFLRNHSQWVEGVDEWSVLQTVDSGTDPRAVIYPKNPMCLGSLIAREYTAEAPQPDGLRINVPCSASSGGMVFRYTFPVSYMRLAGA